MSTGFVLPDFVERKGSLFLRCDHMNYSRATLNSNWHQARESETKDYEISTDSVRDLRRATYNRIGNITDGTLPNTTYQELCNQSLLKNQFQEQEIGKSLVNEETFGDINNDRDTGAPKNGYGSVLPCHNPDHDKQHLETTHRADYIPPYPYTPAEEKPKDFADHSLAYKKCNSQFSDTADYRRLGRNTWQDESGIYTNTHYKRQLSTYQPTQTIPERLQ
ncbi:cilia- and flagella-associated protein 95-like [Tubulanus polymorphus]|uniref:cilia- and flagella-associated protein 95-like n=1 Tax=Tubulanus polymorphus TaxID=672921 RepID=UPI003DA68EA4